MKEIPLCIPDISRDEEEAVIEVLRSHWLIQGPKNREFEEMFARFIGTRRAISSNSGTSALFLALLALGIKGEVILPSFTFVASANAVLAAGARPVFADIDYPTLNLDPADVEARITPRTEAVMVVHFGGQPADMDEYTRLADRYGLALIEDSAETIGGEYRGRKAGSFGIGCFSFQPTKNITTGEGGMTTTNDPWLADRIATLLGHGLAVSAEARAASPTPWSRSASLVGFNMRLTNFQAALGIVQMKKLDRMNRARQAHAAGLLGRLAGFPGLDLPVVRPDRTHVWQMFTVKVRDDLDRDRFTRFLRDRGVGASVHFQPPVHLQEYYLANGYGQKDLPRTERAAKNIVTLPMYPGLTESDLDYLAETAGQALADQDAR
ncbi:MAG: DegT/DnrJ/EryC1/StrS family aminotransferase [Pseudomonadota bacterium]